MDTSVLIWFIIFIIALLLFFGTAVVIAIVGIRDLKDLLSGSVPKE